MSAVKFLAAALVAFALGAVLAAAMAGADPSDSLARLMDALAEEAAR